MIYGWVFVLTLHMASMGGGGTVEATIRTTTVDLCHALRHAVMQQLSQADGEVSPCIAVVGTP